MCLHFRTGSNLPFFVTPAPTPQRDPPASSPGTFVARRECVWWCLVCGTGTSDMDTKFCECWRSKGPGGEQRGRGPGVWRSSEGQAGLHGPKAQGNRFGNVRTEGRECALVGNAEPLERSWEYVCSPSMSSGSCQSNTTLRTSRGLGQELKG